MVGDPSVAPPRERVPVPQEELLRWRLRYASIDESILAKGTILPAVGARALALLAAGDVDVARLIFTAAKEYPGERSLVAADGLTVLPLLLVEDLLAVGRLLPVASVQALAGCALRQSFDTPRDRLGSRAERSALASAFSAGEFPVLRRLVAGMPIGTLSLSPENTNAVEAPVAFGCLAAVVVFIVVAFSLVTARMAPSERRSPVMVDSPAWAPTAKLPRAPRPDADVGRFMAEEWNRMPAKEMGERLRTAYDDAMRDAGSGSTGGYQSPVLRTRVKGRETK